MKKALVILEVSQKQSYIFSSNKLRENIARSSEIAYVTGDLSFGDFFSRAAGDAYRRENLIYAGGGHTVFQFDTPELARAFVRRVTRAAMTEFPDMELFARVLDTSDYPDETPGGLFQRLSAELERKKSVRASSFRRMSLGVEALDTVTWKPKRKDADGEKRRFQAEDRRDFAELAGDEGFIAVVHIDGNGMGARVQDIYKTCGGDWDACCRSLRSFSDGIAQDFTGALDEMESELTRLYGFGSVRELPLRRVIAAGDDICFVCRGSLGPEAARIYLEKLAKKENIEQPGRPYAACAGVAIVHTKYPFHMAYDLAEELCSNAKRLGAEIDVSGKGRVSAIDWHIEFGQLKDSLAELREDYRTEDSTEAAPRRMDLRPLTVVVPRELEAEAERVTGGFRTWEYFRRVVNGLETGKIARSKLKGLRTAVRQGKTETAFYLQEIDPERELCRAAAGAAGKEELRDLFVPINGVERCVLFDAVELMDHSTLGKEMPNE